MPNDLPSSVVADVQFVGRSGGAVKALSGFKKGHHTVPDAANATTNAFLGKISGDELAQQAEAKSKLAHGAAVPGENPRIAAAQAQRASARLSLSRTEIRAPMAGRVAGSTRLQLGQQAIAELPMFTLVGVEGTYVEANFKETDLDDMKVGQPVKITFDAYPELKIRGHVSSIGSGTASEFSVLPAQNASGNWVKVTQRVPVRIAIDEKSPRALIAGLSAHVTVYTDGRKN